MLKFSRLVALNSFRRLTLTIASNHRAITKLPSAFITSRSSKPQNSQRSHELRRFSLFHIIQRQLSTLSQHFQENLNIL